MNRRDLPRGSLIRIPKSSRFDFCAGMLGEVEGWSWNAYTDEIVDVIVTFKEHGERRFGFKVEEVEFVKVDPATGVVWSEP